MRWLPANALIRALIAAVAATALLAPVARPVMARAGVSTLSWSGFMTLKLMFGLGLAAIVAPLAALASAKGPALASAPLSEKAQCAD